MLFYRTKNKKICQRIWIFVICKISIKQIWKTIIGYRTRCSKNAFEKVVHGAGEATSEFIGNKIADKTVEPKPASDENPRNAEEIITPPEKREEILNKLRQVLWNTIKYVNYQITQLCQSF